MVKRRSNDQSKYVETVNNTRERGQRGREVGKRETDISIEHEKRVCTNYIHRGSSIIDSLSKLPLINLENDVIYDNETLEPAKRIRFTTTRFNRSRVR